MAGSVLHDDVDVEIGGDVLFDPVEEASGLLGEMAWHALADDGAGPTSSAANSEVVPCRL